MKEVDRRTHTHTHKHKAGPLLTAIPKLAGLTVHAWQQQPGSLPDIIAVYWEAAPVLCVNDGHTHPLHQRRQDHERPVGGDRYTHSRWWTTGCGLRFQPSARVIHQRQLLHMILAILCSYSTLARILTTQIKNIINNPLWEAELTLTWIAEPRWCS